MSSLLLGLVAALCWGVHDITIRYLSSTVPILGALFVVLIAGTAFQGMALAYNGVWIRLPITSLGLSILAGIALLGASTSFYFALKRGPIGLVAPLVATYPLVTILFSLLGGRELSGLQLFAVAIVVVGVSVVAIFAPNEQDSNAPKMGTIVLSLAASLFYATTFHVGQLAALDANELVSSFLIRLTATFFLGGVLIALKQTWSLEKSAIIPLSIMGLLDGVALLSIFAAANLPNPEFASVSASTFGIFTISLAYVFLKERLNLRQIIGCGLAFAALGYLAL